MRYRKEFVSIWKIDIILFVAFLTENLYDKKTKNPVRKLDIRCLHFTALTPTSYKSWSVPVRAKPCETQSLTQSLVQK